MSTVTAEQHFLSSMNDGVETPGFFSAALLGDSSNDIYAAAFGKTLEEEKPSESCNTPRGGERPLSPARSPGVAPFNGSFSPGFFELDFPSPAPSLFVSRGTAANSALASPSLPRKDAFSDSQHALHPVFLTKETTELTPPRHAESPEQFIGQAFPSNRDHTAFGHRFHGQPTPPQDNADESETGDVNSTMVGSQPSAKSLGGKVKNNGKRKRSSGAGSDGKPSKTRTRKLNAESKANGNGSVETPVTDDKRSRFLERNRMAASKCRQKKKEWTSNLEERGRLAQAECSQLRGLVAGLTDELLTLKSQLLEHSTCDCGEIRQYFIGKAKQVSSNPSVYFMPPDGLQGGYADASMVNGPGVGSTRRPHNSSTADQVSSMDTVEQKMAQNQTESSERSSVSASGSSGSESSSRSNGVESGRPSVSDDGDSDQDEALSQMLRKHMEEQ